jgi:hypothetical protein
LPKNLTQQQTKAIQSYVKKGDSANKIQRKLRERNIGLRRKTLLAEIRRLKGQSPKAGTVKYIPKKYVKARMKVRVYAPSRKRLRWLGGRHVTLVGRHYGKRVVKTQHGSGKDLYRFVMDEMTGDYWDEKPRVFS